MLTVRQKLFLARRARHLVKLWRTALGKGMEMRCWRRGLHWELDLDEGIDFSIYLLGAYDPESIRFYEHFIKPGFQVLDIGANVGSHALPLAKFAGPNGRIFALEPTDFAFAKLYQNRALNLDLADRLVLRQIMLIQKGEVTLPQGIYSSWPLIDVESHLDEFHGGSLKALTHAIPMTLDSFCRQSEIDRIDFIKLDVDGNEMKVLEGGEETLKHLRPPIYMELAPYISHNDSNYSFDHLIDLIHAYGYSIYDSKARRLPSTAEELRKLIAFGASINVLLRQ